MKLIITTLLFLFSVSAQAYIPHFWHIMSRTAENHGRGVYVIDQDVVLSGEGFEPVIIHEQWLVKDGESLRLRAEGKRDLEGQFDLTFVYDRSRKTYINESEQRKTLRLSDDWFEPFFHFRYSQRIKNKMKALNMIPASALRGARKFESLDKVNYKPEEFVKLSRTNGRITFEIGETSQEKELKPGLWVEQDAFTVAKLRLPSMVEVTATDYKRHAAGMWFPEKREVTWQNKRAQIRVTDVRRLGYTNTKRLDANSLDLKKEPHLKAKLPDNELVQEFYKRFR